MSHRQKSKKTQHNKHKESQPNESEFTYKYEPPKKQLVTMPDFENPNIRNEYITQQDENTYVDTNGKYVVVDQVRYNNLLNKLNELQQEFAALNQDETDEGGYSVNRNYRKMQSSQVLKTVDQLNE